MLSFQKFFVFLFATILLFQNCGEQSFQSSSTSIPLDESSSIGSRSHISSWYSLEKGSLTQEILWVDGESRNDHAAALIDFYPESDTIILTIHDDLSNPPVTSSSSKTCLKREFRFATLKDIDSFKRLKSLVPTLRVSHSYSSTPACVADSSPPTLVVKNERTEEEIQYLLSDTPPSQCDNISGVIINHRDFTEITEKLASDLAVLNSGFFCIR